MLLGAWWLQNQYQTSLRLIDRLDAMQREFDDRYISKDVHKLTQDRMDRIQRELEKIGHEHKQLKEDP